jgi:hypothetical protein
MNTDASLAGILIQETNSEGLITLCQSNGNLSTAASKFAVGCIMTDTTTGKEYANQGTVAVPSWNSMTDVDNADMDSSLIKVLSVNLTAAQINALYTTSVEIIPAVSGKAIILDDMVLDLTGTATQFTAGGVVNLQYKNTANGAGTTLHADIAATVVTGATGRVVTKRIAKDLSAIATADIVGIGVFVGAKTQNFATGTGTAKVIVRYHLI